MRDKGVIEVNRSEPDTPYREELQNDMAILTSGLVEEYRTTQDVVLQEIVEAREILQETTHSRAVELKDEVVYATHLLRYGG